MKELAELNKAVKDLEKIKKASELMPEVRMNFAYAKNNSKKIEDVAAIDGRITVVNGKLKTAGKVKFGASDHLARLLIEIAKYNKTIRSAVNFKFSKEIISAVQRFCNKNNLIVGKIDRKKEPMRTQIKDGKSIQWKVKYLYKTNHNHIPIIFYENEGWGKEPLFVVVGETPSQVLKIVKGIIREI